MLMSESAEQMPRFTQTIYITKELAKVQKEGKKGYGWAV